MDLPLTRPGSGGLGTLYKIYQWFLNDEVQSQTVGELIEENNIQKWSDFDADFLSDWQSWTSYFSGFIAAIVIGVFLVISMPILGLCYCWCRSICRCLPQCLCCKDPNLLKSKPVSPPGKCKTWCCVGMLISLVCTMFSMVVLAFVLNDHINNELTSDSLMERDIVEGFDNIESYLKGSIDDIEDALVDPFNETGEELLDFVDNWPSHVIDGIETTSGIEPALSYVDSYVDNLPYLHGNLSLIQNLTAILEHDIDALNQNLTQSRSSIEILVEECITKTKEEICYTIKGKLSDLEANANLTNVADVSMAIAAIENELALNISDDVKLSLYVWNNVSMEIEASISGDVDSIADIINDLEKEIETVVNDINTTLSGLSLSSAKTATEDIQSNYLDVYAPYIYIAVAVSTSICLLIVLLYGSGLIMGLFGGPRLAKHAANILMASIGFFLLFGWFFILFTTVTFTVGGGMEVFVCRHAVGYDDTMSTIETVTKNQFEVAYKISGKELLENCSENNALYPSFNLAENGYNISEYLDLSNLGIYEALEGLRNVSVSVIIYDILQPDLEARLHQLYGNTSAIVFETYTTELSKDLISLDIDEFHSNLLEASDILADYASLNLSDLSDQFREQARVIDELRTLVLPSIEESWNDFSEAVYTAESLASGPNISEAIYNISDAETTLNTSMDSVLEPVLNSSTDHVVDIIDSYVLSVIDNVENDVAPCQPFYQSLQAIIYAPCVYFLYPFNALWFCYGWYFAFGLLSVFISTSYVDILRFQSNKNKLRPTSATSTTLSFVEDDVLDGDLNTGPVIIPPIKAASVTSVQPMVKDTKGISLHSEKTRVSIVSNTVAPIDEVQEPIKDGPKHQYFLNYLDFVYGSSRNK